MERKELYSIEEVLPKIVMELPPGIKRGKLGRECCGADFNGDLINMCSLRYHTFALKGTKCTYCGLEAQYFAKERHTSHKFYHLNLYGVDSEGVERLFTRDHVVPLSKGGADHIDNLVTACFLCNKLKDNN